MVDQEPRQWFIGLRRLVHCFHLFDGTQVGQIGQTSPSTGRFFPKASDLFKSWSYLMDDYNILVSN